MARCPVPPAGFRYAASQYRASGASRRARQALQRQVLCPDGGEQSRGGEDVCEDEGLMQIHRSPSVCVGRTRVCFVPERASRFSCTIRAPSLAGLRCAVTLACCDGDSRRRFGQVPVGSSTDDPDEASGGRGSDRVPNPQLETDLSQRRTGGATPSTTCDQASSGPVSTEHRETAPISDPAILSARRHTVPASGTRSLLCSSHARASLSRGTGSLE
jgi:hypothetical protein